MTIPLLCLLFLHCTITLAQSPAQSPVPPLAPSPAPSGPTNITAILEKGGQFSTLIRLLKSTHVGDQIDSQLKNSNAGLTIFAPTDSAFSGLKTGTLNSLSDEGKVQLMQFHVIPTVLSTSQFQTASNPIHTQAGNSGSSEFPLNVTTSGNNVNITTGVVNATVANTVYSDSSIAVYQVDKVLLPMALFGPQAPAPAPVEGKNKPVGSTAGGPSQSLAGASDDTSGALGILRSGLGVEAVGVGVAVFAVFSLWV